MGEGISGLGKGVAILPFCFGRRCIVEPWSPYNVFVSCLYAGVMQPKEEPKAEPAAEEKPAPTIETPQIFETVRPV